MNKVFISGRLVRDPESRVTTNGKSLCTFSIANNMRYGNNKKTGFYNVTAWGNSADVIARHYEKGHQIFITATDLADLRTHGLKMEGDHLQVFDAGELKIHG